MDVFVLPSPGTSEVAPAGYTYKQLCKKEGMDLVCKQKRDNMLAVCSSILNSYFDSMNKLHLCCMIIYCTKAMSGTSKKLNQSFLHA